MENGSRKSQIENRKFRGALGGGLAVGHCRGTSGHGRRALEDGRRENEGWRILSHFHFGMAVGRQEGMQK